MDCSQLVRSLRPLKLQDFIGNSGKLKLISKNLVSKKSSQLMLFTGDNGVGKSTLAEYMGLSLACNHVNEYGDPCLQCDTCKTALSSTFTSGSIKKYNMTTLCDKKEVLDVMKEIFVFEGLVGRNIYILEELQALSKDKQEVFLEYFTHVPDDVYVFICTDNISAIIPPIRNRFMEIHLDKPTAKEATEFVITSCNKVGLAVESSAVAKLFAKANKNNPRAIITSLEFFRSIGQLQEKMVMELFNENEKDVNKAWFDLFNTDTTLSDFVSYVTELADEQDIKKLCNEVHRKSIMNLIESKAVIEGTELSTVEKGKLKTVIQNAGVVYEKVLNVFKDNPVTDEIALNILTRAKLVNQMCRVTEAATLGKEKIRSITQFK